MKLTINNKTIKIIGILILLVYSAYYVIAMTDYCGIHKGNQYTKEQIRDALPNSVSDSFDSASHIYYFRNRFGCPVVARHDIKGCITEINCYPNQLIHRNNWGFLQITPGMELGQIISRVGIPSSIGGSGIISAWYNFPDGKKVIVFLSKKMGKDGSLTFVSNGRLGLVTGDGSVQRYTISYLYPIFVVSVGVITAVVILLRLKKKGILCKKKQSTE